MVFGSILGQAHPKFRQYYVAYADIKEFIKQAYLSDPRSVRPLPTEGTDHLVDELFPPDEDEQQLMHVRYDALQELRMTGDRPELTFQRILKNELAKINQFSMVNEEEIFRNLQYITRYTLRDQQHLKDQQAVLAMVEADIDEQADAIAQLDTYVRVNYKAIMQLCTIFDRAFRTTGFQWYMASIKSESFCSTNIDRLVLALSITWNKFRTVAKDLDESEAWKPPDTFERKTTKYWLRYDKLIAAKTLIVKHLPYLVFGASPKEQEEKVFQDPLGVLSGGTGVGSDRDSSRMESLDKPLELQDKQLVSSVYFDNTSATCYTNRIMRLEGAELIRFRWYGFNDAQPDKEIFVERKTHHEGWTGESSTKERFAVPQQRVLAFMRGEVTIDDLVQEKAKEDGVPMSSGKYNRMLQLGREVQTSITQLQLQPVLRTSYYRSAYQLSASNEVRISLDENLCMVNELLPEGQTRDGWCRLRTDVLCKEEVVKFPYAVLEVKLQASEPEWVKHLLTASAAIDVYKFSKYQHGIAFLHRNLVPELPHWFEDFESKGYVAGRHRMTPCTP
mmetsp:Transcript_45705/g.129041  ORF Transcript_45705/g.129041 Transcript_45705/m.129041 type:complete len:561 (-) Transcript_45705:620-2302(-)